MNERVQICIREGPIILLNAPATGVMATYPLWDGASASEFFPPGEEHFYDVTLEKPATHAGEVRLVEEQLTNALMLIAAAWSFSGGSCMAIKSRQVISSSAFKSNADEVERQLLASDGLTKQNFQVSQTHTSYSATYSRPPLEHAIKIARTMHLDHVTEKLVRYYHEALVNRPPPDEASWFVNLYKVRDLLQKHYHSKQMKGRQAAQTALSISDKEWCKFGNVLNNNDLRHAETGKAPSVSPPRVKDVYDIARRWVAVYLKTKRLTTF